MTFPIPEQCQHVAVDVKPEDIEVEDGEKALIGSDDTFTQDVSNAAMPVEIPVGVNSLGGAILTEIKLQGVSGVVRAAVLYPGETEEIPMETDDTTTFIATFSGKTLPDDESVLIKLYGTAGVQIIVQKLVLKGCYEQGNSLLFCAPFNYLAC